MVVLLECSQLWCSASKLQKVSLRTARVTPFFSQLWSGGPGIYTEREICLGTGSDGGGGGDCD